MIDQLQALIERHCVWLHETVDRISALVWNLGSSACAEDVRQAYELTHEITGSSGTMGFAQVSAAAAALEEKLKPMAASAPSYSNEDIRTAQNLFNDLVSASRGVKPQESSLFGVDLAAVAAR